MAHLLYPAPLGAISENMRFLFLVILIGFYSCNNPNSVTPKNKGDNKDFILAPESLRIAYISNPRQSDTTCIKEIKRAKNDIASGKLILSDVKSGFSFNVNRSEKYLKQLCVDYGLEYAQEPTSCLITSGQTQGCYGHYMNKAILEKFGVDFKTILHKKADSLLTANPLNDTVESWLCDEISRLPNEEITKSSSVPTQKNYPLTINSEQNHSIDLVYCSFVVNIDSTITDFKCSAIDSQKQISTDLLDIILKSFNQSYPIWVPGNINHKPVITKNGIYLRLNNKST